MDPKPQSQPPRSSPEKNSSLEKEEIIAIKSSLENDILTHGVSSYTESYNQESYLTRTIRFFIAEGKYQEAIELWKKDFAKIAPEGDSMGISDEQNSYRQIVLFLLKGGKTKELQDLKEFKKKTWMETSESRERVYESVGIASTDDEKTLKEREKILILSSLDQDFLKNNLMKALQLTKEIEDILVATPENTNIQIDQKLRDYKLLAKVRIQAGLEASQALNEIERLTLAPRKPEKSSHSERKGFDIFRDYIDLCVLSIDSEDRHEERVKNITAMGYELQNQSDQRGALFGGMIEAEEKTKGHSWKAGNFQIESIEFPVYVSTPLAEKVIPALVKKEGAMKAVEVAESGLLDTENAAQAYVSILLSLGGSEKDKFDDLYSRLQELLTSTYVGMNPKTPRDYDLLEVGDVKRMELYKELMIGLVEQGEHERALRVVDTGLFVEKKERNGVYQLDKKDILVDVIHAIRKKGGDVSILLGKVQEPFNLYQYAALGLFDKAQELLMRQGYENERYYDIMFLITEMRRSDVDVSSVVKKVSNMLVEPKTEEGQFFQVYPFYDSEMGPTERSVELLVALH